MRILRLTCAIILTLGLLSGLSTLSGFPERACTVTQYAYPDALSALHGLFGVLWSIILMRCGAVVTQIRLSLWNPPPTLGNLLYIAKFSSPPAKDRIHGIREIP